MGFQVSEAGEEGGSDMNSLPVHNQSGVVIGHYAVSFPLVLRRGTQAVHDAVVSYLAIRHRGTAATRRKGEVAGSNRKPWRQKGTGRARVGYRQSPVWRGGGVAFGPHPRSYARKLNKKAARLAFRRALSERIAAGQVKILEALHLDQPKTKLLRAVLKGVGVTPPVLLVTEGSDRNVVLAARNLPAVELTRASDVNVYQLVRYPILLVTRQAMDHLVRRFEGGAGHDRINIGSGLSTEGAGGDDHHA